MLSSRSLASQNHCWRERQKRSTKLGALPCLLLGRRPSPRLFQARQHVLHAGRQDPAEPPNPQILDPSASLFVQMTLIGLTGTIAVTGAQLAGINIYNSLRWSIGDIQTALFGFAPLLALELLLYGRRFQIPPSLQLPPSTSMGSQPPSSSGSSSQPRSTPLSSSSPAAAAFINLEEVLQQGWSLPVLQLSLALYQEVHAGLGPSENASLARQPLQVKGAQGRAGHCREGGAGHASEGRECRKDR